MMRDVANVTEQPGRAGWCGGGARVAGNTGRVPAGAPAAWEDPAHLYRTQALPR